MTNSVAIFLGIAIVGAIVADMLFLDAANLVFLGKKFADMLEWLAFWR